MANFDELSDIASWVLSQTSGGEEIEIVASRGRETEVVAYGGAIESLTQASDGGVGIRIIKDGVVGFAHAGSLDFDAVESTLRSARENATYGTSDPYVGLAKPDGVSYVSLDLYRPEVADFPLDDKVAFAIELEQMVKGLDTRIAEVPHATYGDAYGEFVIASTTGIFVHNSDSYAYSFVQALAREGDETQSGFGYSVGRSPSEIDISQAAKDAHVRSTRLLGAKKPTSGRLAVVFEPRVTSNLLAIIGGSLSAESVQKGRSIFTGREGEVVASELLTLVDDPTDARFQSASPFDGEGLASRRNLLISAGVLQSFLYDSYTARKAAISSTANASRGYASTPSPRPRALTLDPGLRSHQEILKEVGDGFLVQSLSGIHSGVNPTSGDFSVGAEGVMIRGGEIAEGIKEATISSTLQRMLLGITAIGNDFTLFPGISAGLTVAVDEMQLSGS